MTPTPTLPTFSEVKPGLHHPQDSNTFLKQAGPAANQHSPQPQQSSDVERGITRRSTSFANPGRAPPEAPTPEDTQGTSLICDSPQTSPPIPSELMTPVTPRSERHDTTGVNGLLRHVRGKGNPRSPDQTQTPQSPLKHIQTPTTPNTGLTNKQIMENLQGKIQGNMQTIKQADDGAKLDYFNAHNTTCATLGPAQGAEHKCLPELVI